MKLPLDGMQKIRQGLDVVADKTPRDAALNFTSVTVRQSLFVFDDMAKNRQ
jgi:hypothetical protein